VVRTTFATLEDMVFYDDKDQIHQALKEAVRPHIAGLMTVYWEE
jgi:hypothetical protein